MFTRIRRRIAPAVLAALGCANLPAVEIHLDPIGRHATGLFDESAAEIPAYDPVTKRLFVVNANTGVDILDLAEATAPKQIGTIDIGALGTGANSVAVFHENGETRLAIAVERTLKQVDVYRSGYGSGAAKVPGAENEIYLLTDRGPNIPQDELTADGKRGVKLFPAPDFTPRIGRFRWADGKLELLDEILLKSPAGEPITGLPNPGGANTGETPRDLDERDLPTDLHGIDSEGLVALADGTFWISDEYGPHIDHYAADGTRLERINPFTTGAGRRALPAVYATRRANRGMEGLTVTPDGRYLVGLMQSPMYNPASKTTVGGQTISIKTDSALCRLLFFPVDGKAGLPVKEFVYVADQPNLALSEIRAISDTEFLVLERDGAFAKDENKPAKVKRFYKIDVSAATDIHDAGAHGRMFAVDLDGDGLAESLTLEQLCTAERLAEVGVTPVAKSLFLDLLTTDYPHDKPEGFIVLDTDTIAIINDDDFGLKPRKVTPLGGKKRNSGRMVQKILPGSDIGIDRPHLWVVSAGSDGAGTVDGIFAYQPEILVENDKKRHLPGRVAFCDADGAFLNELRVGYLPDMVAVKDGKVVVCNEGEPNDAYDFDPEGSVSIVDLAKGVANLTNDDVKHADFHAFEGQQEALAAAGAHFPSRQGTTLSQDLEPEYAVITKNGKVAWVALQENNALALVNLLTGRVAKIVPLGVKDHRQPGKGLDPSNKDGKIAIANHPVFGLYQPDAIASVEIAGATYIITANEGDARDYDGYSEETRAGTFEHFSPMGFSAAEAARFADKAQLGRIKTTTAKGDANGDGFRDAVYTYGARSFSILNDKGEMVYDSGDEIERFLAQHQSEHFNSTNDENGSFDDRSDDKGPEPEGVTVGTIGDHTFAFIGLERHGGVIVYDISDPLMPEIAGFVNTRDYAGDPKAGTAGDLAPEGLVFIPASESPDGTDLLVVAFEVSGTTTVFRVGLGPKPAGEPAPVAGPAPAPVEPPAREPVAIDGGMAPAGAGHRWVSGGVIVTRPAHD